MASPTKVRCHAILRSDGACWSSVMFRTERIPICQDSLLTTGVQKSKRGFTQSIAMKSIFVTYLLWLCSGFGVLGLQRFYLGRWITGLLWLFTLGFFGIGAILDLILNPGMVRIENLSHQLIIEANRH